MFFWSIRHLKKNKIVPKLLQLRTVTHYVIDLRSDTVSLPTPDMRKAMFEAVVGDDVYREDPTVNQLEKKSAELLGKEAALFVSSGTMANLLAIMVHCHRRGTEAIVGGLSHIFSSEQGAAAHIAGVQLTTINNNRDGTFCLNEFREKIRSVSNHEPITSLAVVENTHNTCGGKVLPVEWLDNFTSICREHNAKSAYRLALHMDGARLFNAAEYMNISARRIVKDFDSVSFCLSKSLSAPVGSMLVGAKDFINEARRLRKGLGGGMRQAGVLAAAGIVALDTIIPKLIEDHRRTREIAEAIDCLQSPHIGVDLENVQTNILMIQMLSGKISSEMFVERLREVTEKEIQDEIISDVDATTKVSRGICLKISDWDRSVSRLVLYHQISDADVQLVIKKIEYVVCEYDDDA